MNSAETTPINSGNSPSQQQMKFELNSNNNNNNPAVKIQSQNSYTEYNNNNSRSSNHQQQPQNSQNSAPQNNNQGNNNQQQQQFGQGPPPSQSHNVLKRGPKKLQKKIEKSSTPSHFFLDFGKGDRLARLPCRSFSQSWSLSFTRKQTQNILRVCVFLP